MVTVGVVIVDVVATEIAVAATVVAVIGVSFGGVTIKVDDIVTAVAVAAIPTIIGGLLLLCAHD